MDTYSTLREFAATWALVGLFVAFLVAVFWAWRPGSRSVHEDAGRVPFRNEDRPLPSRPAASPEAGPRLDPRPDPRPDPRAAEAGRAPESPR
jgi:cytochrome c oxidase cbb3-type subunit 4